MLSKKIKALVLVAAGFLATSVVTGVIKSVPQSTPAILLDQVGYLPSMEKVFFFQADTVDLVDAATFDIVDDQGSKAVSGQPMAYLGELWEKHYAAGNFSSFTDNGTFQIIVHADGQEYRSAWFAIGDGVYGDVLKRAVQFYYYMRCGTEAESIIPGYVGHKLCHADDGYWNDSGTIKWKDLSGGWHDAGDYGKYMEVKANTQYSVWSLANAYEQCKAYFDGSVENLYDSDAPDVVDEAMWGARFLQKMIQDDGTGEPRVFSGVYGRERGQWNRFGYWGDPSSETDNIPRSGDDRMVGSLYVVSGDTWSKNHDFGSNFINATSALMVAAAMAKTAWISKDFSHWDAEPFSPTALLANATALHDSHIRFIVNATLDVNSSLSFSDLWTPLLCVTELARWANHEGNVTAWNTYTKEASAIRARLLATAPTDTEPSWSEANMALISLVQHDNLINGSVLGDLQAFVTSFSANTLEPKASMLRNYFNYFQMNAVDSFWYFGASGSASVGSAAAALAWNVTGTPSVKNIACDNVVHWILGRNPLDICQMESLGTRNLPVYHNRYVNIPGNLRGAVPGTIPNGIARPSPVDINHIDHSPDLPSFDMHPPNPEAPDLADFRTNEVYTTNNADFLLGFSTLMRVLGV